MKRKKIDPTSVAAVQRAASVPVVVKPASFGRLPSWALPAVLLVMLYFALFLPSGRMSMILTFAVLAMALVFHKAAIKNLHERLSLPVLALFAFFLLTGLAAIYAPIGENAANEFMKALAFVPVALVVLLWTEKHHIRSVLWGLAALLAFAAVLCVDTSGWGLFYDLFCALMDSLGAAFSDINQYVTAGRINGIYNNANVTSSMFAIGGLLSVFLARTGEKMWEKPLACFLMGLNAMAFFLSMSRGAILCFGVTLIAYVCFTGKEDRLSLVFFLVETVVVTVLFSAVAMRFLGDSGSILPDLLTLACGPTVYALDRFAGAPAAVKLAGKGRAIAITCGGLTALLVVYIVAALSITGAYTFVSGQRLYRTVELPAGAYVLSGEYTGSVTVEVVSIDSGKLLDEQAETLYSGELEEAAFTVSEGSDYVEFIFYGETGDVLSAAELSDGTELPLSYPLLPAFLANRLQEGVLSGSSFTMRAQYVKDGLKLFMTRPLLGYGLGGSEGWIVSVQPFYYESKYLHNHVVQVMTEMGLLGLIAFLSVLLGSAWLLLRRFKQERDGLAAVLLACWLMMNLHSLMEINFSIRAYQCMAFVLLALIMVAFPKPLFAKERRMKKLSVGAVAFAALWLAFFGGTYQMHRLAQNDFENMEYRSNSQIMADTETLIKRDIYAPEDMQISYIANASVLNSPLYNGQAQKYAGALRGSGVYVGCTAVSRYYYLPRGDYENVFACSREGLEHLKAYRDSWNLQFIYYFEEVLPTVGPENFETFVAEVNATRAMLAEYEAQRLETIDMAVLVQTYLDGLDAVAELPAEEAYGQLLLLVQENA